MQIAKNGYAKAVLALKAVLFLTLSLLATIEHARACGGAPPPFFCAKTYVFAKAGDLNLVAEADTVLNVNTLHFLNLIEFPVGGGNCPAPPFSVTMLATLACDQPPDVGPVVLGPFVIPEGFTEIPIEIPIPAGPPRVCDLVITSRVTFSDGSIIQQQADQKVCIIEPAPTEGTLAPPRIDIQHVGGDVQFAHPGDQRSFVYRVFNNDPTETFEGTITVDMRNVSTLPTVIAGQNDGSSGVYSVADPGDASAGIPPADNAPIAFGEEGSCDCVPLPPVPHEALSSKISRGITVGPGQTEDVEIKTRYWSMCAHGSCGESTFLLNGAFSDGSPATACAGGVSAADINQPADFFCPDESGRAALASAGTAPEGPVARVTGDATRVGNQPFQVDFVLDIASMNMLINGTPIIGGTPNFSGVTQVDGQYGRMVAEFSFINPQAPQDALITMVYDFIVRPAPGSVGDFDTFINDLTVVKGTVLDDVAPFAMGQVGLNGLNGFADAPLDVFLQFNAIGVKAGTFDQVPMNNVSLVIEILDAKEGRFRVTSEWTATNPEPTPNMIGFDVNNDIRTYARSTVTTAPCGACCAELGPCQDNIEEGYCEGTGGAYQGDGTLCADTICPEPTGACCFSDGDCFAPMFQSDCIVGGNDFFINQTCDEVECPDCSDDDDCDDGLFCNGVETCVDNACVPGDPPCPPEAPCDEDIDLCIECTDHADCDNGVFCDGLEGCMEFGCIDGPLPCEPDEVCEEANQICFPPVCSKDADCDDGLFCNGMETCVDNACVPGDPPCPPEAPCDEQINLCIECKEDADCDNGIFCDGPEDCFEFGCMDGPEPCEPGEVCDEENQSCEPCTTDADCDDGQACNGAEGCDSGTCVAGSPVECSPVEICEEPSGECVPLICGKNADCGACCTGVDQCINTTDSGCDDEEFFPGVSCAEIECGGACCFDDGGCEKRLLTACPDFYAGDGTDCFTPNVCDGACCFGNNTCQDLSKEECDAASGEFQGVGSNCFQAKCDIFGACCAPDGACSVTTEDDCTAGGGAFAGFDSDCDPNPCGCTNDAVCQDGDACNGAEFCNDGTCQPGVPLECDDGNECTTDFCDPADGCQFINDPNAPPNCGACCVGNQGNCQLATIDLCINFIGGVYQGDGIPCDPNPCACESDGDCADENECTENACDLETGQCVATPVEGTCDDGNPCTSNDVCVSGQCGGGPNIISAEPASGTVDARQPHDPFGPPPLQGIGCVEEPIIVTTDTPASLDGTCWDICDTADNSNFVSSVTMVGENTYSVVLDKPITPNAVTTINFSGSPTAITYTFHPANVNADTAAGVGDVLFLIDVLNGQSQAPFGMYSTDVDHSGVTGAPDVLRTVDLLNGALEFDVQNLTTLPESTGCRTAAPIICASPQDFGLDEFGQFVTPDFAGLHASSPENVLLFDIDENLLSGDPQLFQTPPAGTTFTGPQIVTISFVVTDDKGNSSSCDAWVNLVDETGPQVNVTGVQTGDQFIFGQTVPVNVIATDNLDPDPQIDARLDGNTYIPGTPVSDVGIHVLRGTATDASGNTTGFGPVVFEILPVPRHQATAVTADISCDIPPCGFANFNAHILLADDVFDELDITVSTIRLWALNENGLPINKKPILIDGAVALDGTYNFMTANAFLQDGYWDLVFDEDMMDEALEKCPDKILITGTGNLGKSNEFDFEATTDAEADPDPIGTLDKLGLITKDGVKSPPPPEDPCPPCKWKSRFEPGGFTSVSQDSEDQCSLPGPFVQRATFESDTEDGIPSGKATAVDTCKGKASTDDLLLAGPSSGDASILVWLEGIEVCCGCQIECDLNPAFDAEAFTNPPASATAAAMIDVDSTCGASARAIGGVTSQVAQAGYETEPIEQVTFEEVADAGDDGPTQFEDVLVDVDFDGTASIGNTFFDSAFGSVNACMVNVVWVGSIDLFAEADAFLFNWRGYAEAEIFNATPGVTILAECADDAECGGLLSILVRFE